ncbi:MAG: hypothetical protein V3S21_07995 [Xanthomonadales bacterium]
MQEVGHPKQTCRASFKPLVAILIVMIVLLAISLGSDWYADKVLLPRYCGNVPETVRLLEEVLTEARPAGTRSRIPYLIAAKITVLLPQRSSEDIPAYLQRVQLHLQRTCG